VRLVHYYPTAKGPPSGVTAAIELWAQASLARGANVTVLHGQRESPGFIKHWGSRRPTFVPIGLGQMLRSDDVLILHEGWTLSNLVAARTAQRLSIPYVVMPHGVYEPGIMAGLKLLRGPRRWLEARMLAAASAVHVHHQSEQPLVHMICANATIMVAPTCVEVARCRWTGKGGYLAWLGRLDLVHKGLDVVVKAVSSLPPEERPQIRLHGQDFNGGLAELQSILKYEELSNSIELAGPIWGNDKDDFLMQADGYLHLAAWECMSILLLEALAAGIPCLISDRMHISKICREYDAAIVVSREPEAVAQAFGLFAEDCSALGNNAKKMLQEVYNWDKVIPSYLLAMNGFLANVS